MSREETFYGLRGQEPLIMEGSNFVNSMIAESSVFQGNVSTAGGAVNISLGGPVSGHIKDIVDWLSPRPYNETHVAISEQRQENTGQWFVDEVRKWLAEPDSQPFFWCCGIPGAGKTVLMSAAVDDILSKPQVRRIDGQLRRIDGIAYIYFNYKQQESQTLRSIYASLVAQLVHQVPVLQGTVKEFYKKHDGGKKVPSAEELFRVLSSLSSSCQVVLAFDALDEASARTRIGLIRQLEQLENRSLLIFLTSRPDVQLNSIWGKTRPLNVMAKDSDLETFARAHLQAGEAQYILDERSEPIISKIIQQVISHAEGMFLLADFQIKEICRQTCEDEMLEVAATMPSNPASIYERTIAQIASQGEKEAQLANDVLLWLTLAKRHLSVPELVEALAVQPNTTQLSAGKKRTPTVLVKVCRGLVVIDDKSSIIRLAHLTVQDYLARTLPDIRTMQEKIICTCLTYLSFDVFASGCCTSDVEMRIRLLNNPLLSYAARYWGYHAKDVPEHRIKDLVTEFLQQQSKVSCYIQVSFVLNYLGYGTQDFPRNITGLQVAASFGFEETTEALLILNADVNAADSRGRTALQAAAREGHVGVVERLLKVNADVNAADRYGRTALHMAAERGRIGVVERLLAAGADVNATTADFQSQTALHKAAEMGHVEVVDRLLAAGADVNATATDLQSQTALQAAAERGRIGVVERLIAAGANINDTNRFGQTALHRAAEMGHVEVVDRLLKLNADVDTPTGQSRRTALQAAAGVGHVEVVERLLATGANVNAAAGRYGLTALQAAAKGGHVEVVERLLATGANVNAAAGRYGLTALQAAAKGRHVEVVERLLAAGANVNDTDLYGQTALHMAAETGRVEVVERLFAKGADVNAPGFHSQTALQGPAERGHVEVVDRLLKMNADVNAADRYGRTALQLAEGKKHVLVLERLQLALQSQ